MTLVEHHINPKGRSSKERYAWISQHLANAGEEVIRIRKEI